MREENRKHIVVIAGGQSAEHEVSLLSMKNVVAALDPQQYQVAIIYISEQGEWYYYVGTEEFSRESARVGKELIPVTLNFSDRTRPFQTEDGRTQFPCDCVFPVIHGTGGEDGTLQGLLEMLNVPYVGSGVLSTALCMDKHMAKNILRDAGLPVLDFEVLTQLNRVPYETISAKFGPTLFVKPANLGSSVGVSKVRNKNEYEKALDLALSYDTKILVEPFCAGREIECSVLGNENPKAALPGEILPVEAEFYSYEAKYLDVDGAKVITPASLTAKQVATIQEISLAAFKALGCEGMARVDFFLTEKEAIINELNTIPGFTNISMYPKNWLVSGLSYEKLLDELIILGFQRFSSRQVCARSRENPQAVSL